MTVTSADQTGAEVVVTTFSSVESGTERRTYEARIERNEIEDFIEGLEAGVQKEH
ncbi:hypothetical protein [Aeromicrobium duanguangcaii]|uniref:hypothetical protein n=1 Tax=Aeromicrobium duanguangcaii TaxID=2968086 RepID=UPI002018202E|nr:hypothetical protein [Aeromicrobium duanguangcaii]MCL3838368.1 hypothetical protein [Aeromicrobium duanguangcaii]